MDARARRRCGSRCADGTGQPGGADCHRRGTDRVGALDRPAGRSGAAGRVGRSAWRSVRVARRRLAVRWARPSCCALHVTSGESAVRARAGSPLTGWRSLPAGVPLPVPTSLDSWWSNGPEACPDMLEIAAARRRLRVHRRRAQPGALQRAVLAGLVGRRRATGAGRSADRAGGASAGERGRLRRAAGHRPARDCISAWRRARMTRLTARSRSAATGLIPDRPGARRRVRGPGRGSANIAVEPVAALHCSTPVRTPTARRAGPLATRLVRPATARERWRHSGRHLADAEVRSGLAGESASRDGDGSDRLGRRAKELQAAVGRRADPCPVGGLLTLAAVSDDITWPTPARPTVALLEQAASRSRRAVGALCQAAGAGPGGPPAWIMTCSGATSLTQPPQPAAVRPGRRQLRALLKVRRRI